ncbi:heme lyase NrfEFG subunit NrfF, partial [Vibrio sp. D173a]|nr:heme lyase NrfEFG subunit NrfF [Vibrio sp. D173a]
MSRLIYAFCLMWMLIASPTLMASDIFVSNNKQVAVEVELFEFDNLAQQQQAIELANTLRC